MSLRIENVTSPLGWGGRPTEPKKDFDPKGSVIQERTVNESCLHKLGKIGSLDDRLDFILKDFQFLIWSPTKETITNATFEPKFALYDRVKYSKGRKKMEEYLKNHQVFVFDKQNKTIEYDAQTPEKEKFLKKLFSSEFKDHVITKLPSSRYLLDGWAKNPNWVPPISGLSCLLLNLEREDAERLEKALIERNLLNQ